MKRSTFTSLARRLFLNSSAPNILAASLLLCGSSCNSASQYVKRVFQSDGTELAEVSTKKDAAVEHAYTAGKEQDSRKVRPLDHAGDAPASASSVAQVDPGPPDIRAAIAAGRDPFAPQAIQAPQTDHPAIQQASSVEVKEAAPLPEELASVKFDPEPRVPLDATGVQFSAVSLPADCPPGACPPGLSGAARPFPGMEELREELICDGGDKGLPVHYEGTRRAGLDTEDTVVEFIDHTGEQHVQPSSEACVYAPRFAAVRSATLPQEGTQVERAAGHHDGALAARMDAKVVADQQIQSDEVKGMLTRERASGLEARTVEENVHQNLAAQNHVKLLNAFEDFRYLREGRFETINPAVIGLAIEAAQEWADGRRPVVIAHDQAGQIVQGRFTVQDYTGVEDLRKKGELSIVKAADKPYAHPGDVITFTIRFDNVGDRELYGIRVVDNLSPRLEYVDGSVDSNLDGELDVQENGAGGQLLTFQFDDPLPGKTGGFVSFQCRVR